MKKILFFVIIFLWALSTQIKADDIKKKEIVSEGKTRTYFLFVPKSVNKEKPAPLLMMLHGSGRDGRILLEHWQKLAEQEGVILVGPNSLQSSGWAMPNDYPKYIYDLVEELKSNYKIDSHRVYLFGHSAGAKASLILSLLESEYFAATAISAGTLMPQNYDLFNQAERKIPIALFVGTKDLLFPLTAVRQTRDAFNERKFIVELTEIPDLDHNYYSKSSEINQKAWDFLVKYRLENEQKYKQYNFAQ